MREKMSRTGIHRKSRELLSVSKFSRFAEGNDTLRTSFLMEGLGSETTASKEWSSPLRLTLAHGKDANDLESYKRKKRWEVYLKKPSLNSDVSSKLSIISLSFTK